MQCENCEITLKNNNCDNYKCEYHRYIKTNKKRWDDIAIDEGKIRS